MKITYIQEGGREVLQGVQSLAGIDQVLAAIQGFWNTIQDQPVLVGWAATPYEAVDDIPRPSQFLAVPRYQRAVQKAAQQHAVAKERLAILHFALENPERFIAVDQAVTEGRVRDLEQYVQELEKLTAELDAVEVPEDELDERLARFDRDPRLPSEPDLPREHPLFELFALPNGARIGHEAFRTPQDFNRSGTCRRRHMELLTPTRLDISPDFRSVRYEYRLDAINRRRNCGSGWKDSDKERFTVHGFVLAELDVERTGSDQATLRVRNVTDNQATKNQNATINFGGDPLIAWIKAKDKSVVEWPEVEGQ